MLVFERQWLLFDIVDMNQFEFIYADLRFELLKRFFSCLQFLGYKMSYLIFQELVLFYPGEKLQKVPNFEVGLCITFHLSNTY